jgi:hypothetical protein
MYNKGLSAEEVLYLYQSNIVTNVNKVNNEKVEQKFTLKKMFGKVVTIPSGTERANVSIYNLNGKRICEYSLAMNVPWSRYSNDLLGNGMYIVRYTFYTGSGRVISSESFKASLQKR